MAEDRRETELSFWQARRNRSVATWVSALTVAMLLVVAVLSRNILLEQWYLRQAHSADREAAIQELKVSSERHRKVVRAKVSEYASMSETERNRKLDALDFRWHLLPLHGERTTRYSGS